MFQMICGSNEWPSQLMNEFAAKGPSDNDHKLFSEPYLTPNLPYIVPLSFTYPFLFSWQFLSKDLISAFFIKVINLPSLPFWKSSN